MKSIKHIIIAIWILPGIFLFTACEPEFIDPEENPEENPVDTLANNNDTIATDTSKHALLELISEDNYWGSLVIIEVDRVMYKLKTTKYTLSNYITDVDGGSLHVDCSKYVETILKEVSLTHYEMLPKSSKSGLTSLAKDYYNYFITMPEEADGVSAWIRITNLEDARPGDIISYIHEEEGSTTGHVMIICSEPEPSEHSPLDMSVIVNDAANSGHQDDCRNGEGIFAEDYQYQAYMYYDNGVFKYSGVGIGRIWFYLGSNSYYRWSSPTGSQVYKNIAIGRLIDIPYNSVH